MAKKSALIFFSFRNHKKGYIEKLFDRLLTAAVGRNIELFRGSLKDLHIEIVDNQLQITESLTGRRIDSFDVVYFELWYKARQQALAAARYCEDHRIPFFSREILHLSRDTKIGELATMAGHGIPLPRTFTSSSTEILKVFRHNPPLNYPFIMKADDGYGGHNNFLIHDFAELEGKLTVHKNLTFVLQEFIPNDRDYRCLVMDGQIKLILRRMRDAAAYTHLNNTSAGADGQMVPLDTISDEAKETVLKAAKVMGRDSFAGVDLIIDSETSKPYILEVNQTPQIEIGAAIDEKMTALLDYMEKLANG